MHCLVWNPSKSSAKTKFNSQNIQAYHSTLFHYALMAVNEVVLSKKIALTRGKERALIKGFPSDKDSNYQICYLLSVRQSHFQRSVKTYKVFFLYTQATQKDKSLEHKFIFELGILNPFGTNEHFSFIHVVTLFFHQWDNFSAPLINNPHAFL